MFTHLLDFGCKRTGTQALGFYVTYMFISLVMTVLINCCILLICCNFETLTFEEGFNYGVLAGRSASVVFSLAITLMIIMQKKRGHHIPSLGLVAAAGILACFRGSLFGMIPAACATLLSKDRTGHNIY
jgi:hypothetical protein